MGEIRPGWQVGVFCHNEADRIAACVESVAAAAAGRPLLLTVICNGTTDGSAATAATAAERAGLECQVFEIRHGDKSNAINQYIHKLLAPAMFTCFVDAFVRVGPKTFDAFEAAYARHPAASILSSIPLSGRTEASRASEIVDVGGHTTGQLYSIRDSFLLRMRTAGLRLPTDLYRGDGFLGAMAAFDLDPRANEWDVGRIVGVRDATYEFQPLSPWRPRDLRRQFRRKIRQMRGRLENAGITARLRAGSFADMPGRAQELVEATLAEGKPLASWLDAPFMALAVRAAHAQREPNSNDLVPRLVRSTKAPA